MTTMNAIYMLLVTTENSNSFCLQSSVTTGHPLFYILSRIQIKFDTGLYVNLSKNLNDLKFFLKSIEFSKSLKNNA